MDTCAHDPHERVESFVFRETDWGALVQPGTKIHIVHGGTEDNHGIYHCTSLLQNVWNMALVRVRTASHLSDVIQAVTSPGRTKTPLKLLVCVSAEAVAGNPDGFDLLSQQLNVTVVVTVPITSIAGRPYSSRSDIAVLFLSSCRVDIETVKQAAVVYRFPQTPYALEQSLWAMPHDMGISWKVGRDTAMHATFAATAPPAVQEEVNRMFWWAASTRLEPGMAQVPHNMTALASTITSPFYVLEGSVPTRLDSCTIRVETSMDVDMLTEVRSDPRNSSLTCAFHIVTDERHVIPIHMVLANCLHEIVVNGMNKEGDEDTSLFLTCPVTFLSATEVAAIASHPSPSKWKSYTETLPEL